MIETGGAGETGVVVLMVDLVRLVDKVVEILSVEVEVQLEVDQDILMDL